MLTLHYVGTETVAGGGISRPLSPLPARGRRGRPSISRGLVLISNATYTGDGAADTLTRDDLMGLFGSITLSGVVTMISNIRADVLGLIACWLGMVNGRGIGLPTGETNVAAQGQAVQATLILPFDALALNPAPRDRGNQGEDGVPHALLRQQVLSVAGAGAAPVANVAITAHTISVYSMSEDVDEDQVVIPTVPQWFASSMGTTQDPYTLDGDDRSFQVIGLIDTTQSAGAIAARTSASPISLALDGDFLLTPQQGRHAIRSVAGANLWAEQANVAAQRGTADDDTMLLWSDFSALSAVKRPQGRSLSYSGMSLENSAVWLCGLARIRPSESVLQAMARELSTGGRSWQWKRSESPAPGVVVPVRQG